MKSIDILEEIKSQRSGSHYIRLSDKELLIKQLKKLKEENILNKYKMTYVYKELDNCILLMIHKQFDIGNNG